MSTCGPASAATLLNVLGHPASEQELARESFTSRGGTENWYLARALRRRGLDVAFELRPTVDGVLPSVIPDDIPSLAIAGVLLPGRAGHFIAILGSDGDSVTFADPIDGKHTMTRAQLLERYHFTGFFMVVRRPVRPATG
jgi:predicted double-glycine peptidase